MSSSPSPSPSQTPYRQIRALYDEDTITVYQAYPSSIADPALAAQRLSASPSFSLTRMTWIKPSWAWMMYRSGYSHKDGGQERVLAIRMRHEHFHALLAQAAVLNHERRTKLEAAEKEGKGVRVQWDPERTVVGLEALPYRSIQVGISGEVAKVWCDGWIVDIADVTGKARRLKEAIAEREAGGEGRQVRLEELVEMGLVPEERVYEVPEELRKLLQMDE